MVKKNIIYLLFTLFFASSLFANSNGWKAPDQEKAKEEAKEVPKFIKEYKKECQILRKIRLKDSKISLNDIDKSYMLLDSPIIKGQEDNFSSVRFAHKRHAALIKDCTKCHHYKANDKDASEIAKCSACHQKTFDEKHIGRIGLKAAYHRLCVDCHKNDKNAPVACIGCHLKNVPDHKEKVAFLSKNSKPEEVTKGCLKCHNDVADNFITTAHWLWKGPSPYTIDRRKDIQHGKGTTALNNY